MEERFSSMKLANPARDAGCVGTSSAGTEFERVGGSQTVPGVRVLAATNEDLGAAVAEAPSGRIF